MASKKQMPISTNTDEAAFRIGTAICRLSMDPGLQLLHRLDLLELRNRTTTRNL